MPAFLFLLLAALPAQAQSTSALHLTLVHFTGGRWPENEIVAIAEGAIAILGRCGISAAKTEVVRVDAEARHRIFHTPTARELARGLRVTKPAVYFVDGTRQRPAFDAEAIGRGNSRSRPELADTVWIVRDARDPAVALAHELAHVLMDSGEHTDMPGNLMREDTAPENVDLTVEQCARLRATGSANGLLR